MHSIDVGGAGIRWASLPAQGIPMILFAVPLKLMDLPTPGRFGGVLQMLGPQEAAASTWRSLWEGGLVGVVGTQTSLLQGYQEQSCLLRRQSLCTQVTPLLPGSMTEGRLPCKRTWSLGGSRSGNIPIQLSS